MTSTAVRWVLVEGTTGEGAPLDRGAVDLSTNGAVAFDADALIDVVLAETAAQSRFHAIGLTCTGGTEESANALLDALSARGYDNVIAVTDVEAAESLAGGLADMGGYSDCAVCLFDPGVALVASVGPDDIIVDRYDRPAGDDLRDLRQTARVVALDLNHRPLDAIFVLGTDDLDPVVASLEAVAAAPVLTAAEADLALARGAAVTAGRVVNGEDAAPAGRRQFSRNKMVLSVFAAAVVTFVVSLSVALGMQLTPNSDEATQNASATGRQEQEPAAPQTMRSAAPPSAKLAAPAPPPAPVDVAPARETLTAAAAAVSAAPPEAAPVDQPPAAVPADPPAYVPPAPAYVPPAAPAYVPPAAPPAYTPPAPAAPVPPVGEPRLRDKIIDKIPLINRFHEPQMQYPN